MQQNINIDSDIIPYTSNRINQSIITIQTEYNIASIYEQQNTTTDIASIYKQQNTTTDIASKYVQQNINI